MPVIKRLTIRKILLLASSLAVFLIVFHGLANSLTSIFIEREIDRLREDSAALRESSEEMRYIVSEIQRITLASVVAREEELLFQAPALANRFYWVSDRMEAYCFQEESCKEVSGLSARFRTFVSELFAMSAGFSERTGEGEERLRRVRALSGAFMEDMDRLLEESRRLARTYQHRVKSYEQAWLAINLLVTSAILGLIWLVFRFLRRNIFAPLENVAATVRTVTRDRNISLRVPAVGRGEVGRLASDLNRMFSELEKNLVSIRRLEEDVEVKSRQLIQQSRSAAMGEMVSMIAHQWRQPLNCLGIKIQDLPEAQEFGELDEIYLNEMVEGSLELIQQMSDTIDGFRNFFRTDNRRALVPMAKPVETAINLLEGPIRNREALLETHYYCNETVPLFPNEMTQVLVNVIKNSLEIFEERKIREGNIRITTLLEEEYAVFRVEDNGGGMDDALIEKVTEPYFTTKEGNGLGLGLYMVAQIVQVHMQGRLRVENAASGVAVTIALPVGDGLGFR